MRKTLFAALFILSFFAVTSAFATMQIPDKLNYQDEQYFISVFPLESHPDVEIYRNPAPATTACWRRYVAKWVIEEEALFWLHKNEKIKAEWYTGLIAIDLDRNPETARGWRIGKIRDKIFYVEKGDIVRERIVTSEIIDGMKQELEDIEQEIARTNADIRKNKGRINGFKSERTKISNKIIRKGGRFENKLLPDNYDGNINVMNVGEGYLQALKVKRNNIEIEIERLYGLIDKLHEKNTGLAEKLKKYKQEYFELKSILL